MKQTTLSFSFKWPLLAVTLALIITSLACQLLSSPTGQNQPGNTPAAPTNSMEPAQPGSDPTAVQGQNTLQPPKGDVDLTKLDASLDQYVSYHQHFVATIKGTYKGARYEYSETVERDINGQDGASQVTTTGSQPLYLYTAHLDGGYYSQQKPDGECRASEKEDTPDRDPVTRLPQIKGAEKVGEDSPDSAVKATHLRFDERSLVGLSGKAEGEAWVAENGALLKYTLTLQISERDFIGTRTWEYALSQENMVQPISLPKSCQPILTDIPALLDARDVLRRPGFMRYTSPSSVEQARQFYLDQLSDWTPLPGTQPQPGDPAVTDALVLAFARPNEDGTGRLLVIQLTAQDKNLSVIVQSTRTKKPVQVDTAGTVTVPTGDSGQTEPTAGSSSAPALPQGLPKYPGAEALIDQSQAMMFQTTDPAEKVADFYKSALEDSGWKMAKDDLVQDAIAQTWLKDNAKIMLVITNQAGVTQVVMTAIGQ